MQVNDEYYSLNLQFGFNVGLWCICNFSIWNKNNSGVGDWDFVYFYMQCSICFINSNFVMGESLLFNGIFDSVLFIGIQLVIDMMMLLESMCGYVLIICGIVRINVCVIIK